MAYASIEDVNANLDESKVLITEDDDEPEQDSAERIIRGYLSGYVEPLEIASWVTPGNTPELIREVAGKLVAAFRYRKLYSEDVNEVSPYAQQLYDEAIGMLNSIKAGSLSIISLTDDEIVDVQSAGLTQDMYYPRDKQDSETGKGRKFTMDLNF